MTSDDIHFVLRMHTFTDTLCSFLMNSADADFPGVYARVSSQYEWIKDTICNSSDDCTSSPVAAPTSSSKQPSNPSTSTKQPTSTKHPTSTKKPSMSTKKPSTSTKQPSTSTKQPLRSLLRTGNRNKLSRHVAARRKKELI